MLSPDAEPDALYTSALHGEGTVWDAPNGRLAWSDVPHRRLLGRHADGFAVDARGRVWSTSGDGIRICAPDRTKLGFLPTPASWCFGGPDMRRLFAAAEDLLPAVDLR